MLTWLKIKPAYASKFEWNIDQSKYLLLYQTFKYHIKILIIDQKIAILHSSRIMALFLSFNQFNISIVLRPHFIEYLCSLIRDKNLDPVTILSTHDLETVIKRANKRLPVRPFYFRHDETLSDSIFHRELIKVHSILLISHLFFLSLFFL